MKSYFIFCFLSLLHITATGAIILPTDFTTILFRPDTVKITSVSESNRLTIYIQRPEDSVLQGQKIPVQGRISQTGTRNYVEVYLDNSTHHIKDNHRKSPGSAKEDIPDMHNINVSQKGNNHNVKINSK